MRMHIFSCVSVHGSKLSTYSTIQENVHAMGLGGLQRVNTFPQPIHLLSSERAIQLCVDQVYSHCPPNVGDIHLKQSIHQHDCKSWVRDEYI